MKDKKIIRRAEQSIWPAEEAFGRNVEQNRPLDAAVRRVEEARTYEEQKRLQKSRRV